MPRRGWIGGRLVSRRLGRGWRLEEVVKWSSGKVPGGVGCRMGRMVLVGLMGMGSIYAAAREDWREAAISAARAGLAVVSSWTSSRISWAEEEISS